MTIEATILDNIISATIVGDINIDVDTADLLANDVTFTGTKTFVDQIRIAGDTSADDVDFMLSARPTSLLDIPAVYLKPTGPSTNIQIAFDLFPKGAPGNFTAATPLTAWMDIVNRDIVSDTTTDAWSLRAGVDTDGFAFITSEGFNGGLAKDLILGVGGAAPVRGISIFGAGGDLPARTGDADLGRDAGGNGTRSFTITNTNTGVSTRVNLTLVADTALGGVTQFPSTATVDSSQWQNDLLLFNTVGNVVVNVPTGKEWQFLVGTAAKSNLKTRIGTDGIASSGYLKSGSFTVGTVPSAASSGAGALIYVSNETGGAVHAFSDATNWRRVTDRTIIS